MHDAKKDTLETEIINLVHLHFYPRMICITSLIFSDALSSPTFAFMCNTPQVFHDVKNTKLHDIFRPPFYRHQLQFKEGALSLSKVLF